MQNIRMCWLVSMFLVFYGTLTFVCCVKQACPYTAQNINQPYQHCATLHSTTMFTPVLKNVHFDQMATELRNGFRDYCNNAMTINQCVLSLLLSQECNQTISELYLSLVTRSNSFCAATEGLHEDFEQWFNSSSALSMDAVERCRPSSFDFRFCKNTAEESRNLENRDTVEEIVRQETEYLLELSLCTYSSVFVGCPSDADVVTLFYVIGEWLPPRLGANTRKILRILRHRNSFYP